MMKFVIVFSVILLYCCVLIEFGHLVVFILSFAIVRFRVICNVLVHRFVLVFLLSRVESGFESYHSTILSFIFRLLSCRVFFFVKSYRE